MELTVGISALFPSLSRRALSGFHCLDIVSTLRRGLEVKRDVCAMENIEIRS